MVVVKIELWPHGDESQAKTIGIAKIVNDGTGTAAKGNYDVELSHAGKFFGRPGNWKIGRVMSFTRTLSPYHLVYYALKLSLGIR